MDHQLRPMNLGEILDRTVQLYRRNFWLFIGTSALPLVFVLALGIPMGAVIGLHGMTGSGAWRNAPLTVVALVLLALAAVPVYLAAYVFSYAGITQAAVSLFRGEKPTFRGTLACVRPRFWTYLGYMLLQGIVAAMVPVLAAGVLIVPLVYLMTRAGADLSTRIAAGSLMALLAAAAIGAMIWLVLGYAMGMAACVAEKKSAWESLLRSWRLSPGTRGRIFVTYLLIMALTFGIAMALSVPLLIVMAVSPSTALGTGSSQALFAIVEIVRVVVDFASQVLLLPVFFIAAVLFYFDQRIRKEGYDIEWMMQQAGLHDAQLYAPQAQDAEVFPPVTPPDTLGER